MFSICATFCQVYLCTAEYSAGASECAARTEGDYRICISGIDVLIGAARHRRFLSVPQSPPLFLPKHFRLGTSKSSLSFQHCSQSTRVHFQLTLKAPKFFTPDERRLRCHEWSRYTHRQQATLVKPRDGALDGGHREFMLRLLHEDQVHADDISHLSALSMI